MDVQENNKDPLLLTTFRRIEKRLKTIACGILGNQTEAEDALQDAFIKLWTRRPNMSNEHEAEAMLTTTIKHLSIDTIRSRDRFRTEDVDNNDAYDMPEDNEQEKRETMFSEIENIIKKQLTPIAQEILHRREYNGESFSKIAQDMNMQETAVRMQLSRARKIIRTTYLQRNHDE